MKVIQSGSLSPLKPEIPRCPPPSRRSPRPMSPICPRSRASSSRPRPPASATRVAPTCCSPCMDKGTAVAGVFTKSKCPSAPVEWCRAKLGRGAARALVVNSGNANAFTGKTGKQSTALTATDCGESGRLLDGRNVPRLHRRDRRAARCHQIRRRAGDARAGRQPGDWMNAAKAIMTTDTFPKVATATVKLGKAKVTINGMAKGAGMIMPDMATMLSFVFTDAPLSPAALQSLLKSGVEDTFNAVTIDGDTSTSDTLLAFATGAAAANGAPKITRAGDPQAEGVHKGVPRSARRSLRAGGARRRGRAKAGRDHRRGRDHQDFGAKNRDVGGEFAAGENRDRRRGRQLGPGGDGGRQGRRARQPRQAFDLVQRHPRRQKRRARSVLQRGGGFRTR